MVHIVQSNPHRWISPFAAMKLNHSSYVLLRGGLPMYRPFELITRILYPTSETRTASKHQQQTILTSLRSAPVTCCTQGCKYMLFYGYQRISEYEKLMNLADLQGDIWVYLLNSIVDEKQKMILSSLT